MRGLLWIGDIWDDGEYQPAWVITDSSRLNAQARKLDGSVWRGIGGSKAKSLKGSRSEFLIGACEIGDRPIVILCEGQPDFAAALGCVWSEQLPSAAFAPVCITGTGNKRFSPTILSHFSNKIVVIPVHNDENCQGAEAAEIWAEELSKVVAQVFLVEFKNLAHNGITRKDGQIIKDLADWHTLLSCDEPPQKPLSSIPQVKEAAEAYAAMHPEAAGETEGYPF
jgi:hypothetical protein